MRNRKFFFMSLTAVTVGLMLQLFAMSQSGAAIKLIASAIELPAEQRAENRAEVNQFIRRGEMLQRLSMSSSMIALVLMAISSRRREPAKLAIIVGLLGIQVVLNLILV